MRNLYEWTMKRAFTSNAILDCMTTDTFRFHRELKEFLARPQRAYGIALPKELGRERDINPVWYIDITPGLGRKTDLWTFPRRQVSEARARCTENPATLVEANLDATALRRIRRRPMTEWPH
jgi:hypothetical protein